MKFSVCINKMSWVISASSALPPASSSAMSSADSPLHTSARQLTPISLSLVSHFPSLIVSLNNYNSLSNSSPFYSNKNSSSLFVRSAWTRRSRDELNKQPNRKSWKQRTDMYMRPFLLNVFFSKRFVHAKVMHRGTCKVISVATTNSRDLRNSLPSLTDYNACRLIGQLIAERSKDADVYAMSYEPRKNERIEGKLGIVIDTIKENGIIFVD
ncbi:50S ribosomal protein L18 [Linum perenne]